MSRRGTLAVVLAATLLGGCTSTIFKTFDLNDGHSKSIDAKQRLILVKKNGGRSGDELVVCAEPSPDAITALGAAFAGSGGTLQGGGSLSFSSSEAAASIGLRTQTIQLLRDGYYRLCEAYMNGALSREQYNLALANIDDVMVKLLVVDAVAGTPRPPAVAITPGVAGTTAMTNLSGDGSEGQGQGEGQGSQTPRTLATSAQVASLQPKLEIETINAQRGGMNEHDAKVLVAALDIASKPSMPALCTSYLADPGYLTQRPLMEPASETYKTKLLDICENLLTQETNNDLGEARATIVDLKGKIASKNDKLKSNGDVIAAQGLAIIQKDATLAAQQEVVDLSKEVARKALENSGHIHAN